MSDSGGGRDDAEDEAAEPPIDDGDSAQAPTDDGESAEAERLVTTDRSPLYDLALIGATLLGVYVLFAGIGLLLGLPANGIVNTLVRITFLSAVYAMLVLALNLQWGYAGLFNIGVAGFMAVGVYTMAMLTGPVDPSFGPPGLGLPLWIGVIGGMVAAGVIGLVAAIPALRLRADYLAIATLALSEIIRITLNSTTFQDGLPAIEFLGVTLFGGFPVGTGGGQGMPIDVNTKTPIRGLFYENPTQAGSDTTALGRTVFEFFGGFGIETSVVLNLVYAVVLVAFVAAFYWLLVRVGNSPFGRVLKAIREDETVAQSLGKDTRVFKAKVFMVGCALMGLAGILWISSRGVANPTSTSFMPITTFYVFLALIIGGAGSNTGSVIGGITFAAILFEGPNFVRRLVRHLVGNNPPAAGNIADAVEALVAGQPELFFGFFYGHISALRFVLVGVLVVLLMKARPEGLLGHRKEVAASVPLGRSSGGDEE